MSDERAVTDEKGNTVTITDEDREKANARAARKAKLAQVMDRGYLNDRLNVKELLGVDKHGQWVRNDPQEITRMKQLGFELDNELGKTSLHGDGKGNAIIGDVILMTTPRENYELLQEIEQERFLATHVRAEAEKTHANAIKPQDGQGFTTRDESTTRAVKQSGA